MITKRRSRHGAQAEDIRSTKAAGFDLHLSKPVDDARLCDALQRGDPMPE